MFHLCDSNRVGRSLFATRTIDVGTLILSDNDLLIRFNPDKLTALDELLANSSSESEDDQSNGWFPPLSSAEFISKFKSLPALALGAVAVINATMMADGDDTISPKLLHLWKHIREMHCPQLPLTPDTVLLMQSCAELLRRGFAVDKVAACWEQCVPSSSSSAAEQTEATATAALVHAVMAMKTNCHRSTDNLWCLFPLASKLAHSCEPNCYFVGPSPANGYTASFVATREIAPREVLSFSYFGGPSLHLTTHQRRCKLQRSHLFVCRCERCDETEDFGAAVTVQCKHCLKKNAASGGGETQLLVRLSCPLGMPDADAPMSASWRCTACNGRSRDSDLPAAAQTLRLQRAGAMEGELSAVGVFFDSTQKLKYATITGAVRRIASNPLTARVVGDSLMCEACRQAVQYFSTMCQLSLRAQGMGLLGGASAAASSAAPRATAFQLIFCWALRYFRALDGSGLIRACRVDSPPHLLVVAVAMQLVDVSLMGSTVEDMTLAKDATPGTGMLAILARHVRPVVEATCEAQHKKGSSDSDTAATTTPDAVAARKKMEKVKLLCELDCGPLEQVAGDSLYAVLCMAMADEWREMGCGRKTQIARSAKEAREEERIVASGGIDDGFQQLLQAWSV